MILNHAMLESLRSLLCSPDLRVLAEPLWGSQNPEHRALIRSKLSQENPDSLLHSSVSHTTGLGMIALASSALGVDAEVTTRVTERPVARISTAEELGQAPGFAALWCAKEAAFKALRPFKQPSVLSQISIGDWKKIDSQTETFRLINASFHEAPSGGLGVIISLEDHTLGFFIFCS